MECKGCGQTHNECSNRLPFCISCSIVICQYNLWLIENQGFEEVLQPETVTNDGKMGKVIPFHVPGNRRIN